MTGVLTGFATLALVIALGYLLAAVRLVDEHAQQVLSRLAFFVAMPCLLLGLMARTPPGHLLSRPLLATAAGVIIAAVPYVAVARLVWRRRGDDTTIGAMCSAYTNSGNLGVPVAAFILGDAALVVPILLLNLVVLQPIALYVLDMGRRQANDADRLATSDATAGEPVPVGSSNLLRALRTPLTNPITIGTVVGVILSATGTALPAFLSSPIALVGDMGVPMVLIAYGSSLRLGPMPGRGAPPAEIGLVTALKLVVQPAGAYLVGRAIGMQGHALLAVAVTSALPSAQNIFVHAVRFNRQIVLARDAIFVTTLGAVPVIAAITALLGSAP